jgi:predicted O-methyltransferase YrrM
MSNRTLGLPDTIYDYLLSVSLREPQILQRLREETAKLPMSMMQIAPEQGQMLSLLVQALRPKRCLEIGVFTGYSSLVVALALPADGHITACDVSEEWTTIARRYWEEAGVHSKIDLYLAPALQTLDRLVAHGQASTFDFAFIDADKESYWGYFERALTLVRAGGLIAIDNTLWGGRPADLQVDDASTRAIRAFNKRLFKDTRVRISLVPIGDGMTLALKIRD